MCLSAKLASLYRVDESRLKLKSIVSNIDCWSSTDVGGDWSRVLSAMALNSGVKLRLI